MKGSENIEYVLSNLGAKFIGITSRWTLLEIIRGIIKRKNLGELTSDEAIKVVSFFLDDINKLVGTGKMRIIEVIKRIIMNATDLILYRNLYAADAVHVKTAELYGAKVMLTDDGHIKRLSGISSVEIISVELHRDKFIKMLEFS